MTCDPQLPLVSVIVPAWNAQATLGETLASAAAQTYPNLEIVIVDDGSTDGTAELARRFCASDPRARLVQQENRGLPAARNRAIAESSGDWIAPLDADDLWHPTKLEKQVGAALSAPVRPGFVYCWYHHIDEQALVLGSGAAWAIEGAALKRLAYRNTIHTVLLSRAAVEEAGGYDPDLRACEDVMIQLEIARKHPVAVVPEYLVGYRKRPGSMSRDTALVIRSWRQVHQRLIAEGAAIPRDVQRWSEAFFAMTLAESSLAEGRYAKALPPVVKAVRLDPLRWGSYVLYRLLRTAARVVRGRKPRLARMHFSEADPRIAIPLDPDEIPGLARLLTRIDERRLRRLAASESLEA